MLVDIVGCCLCTENRLVRVLYLMSKEPEVTLSASKNSRVSLLRLCGNAVEVTAVVLFCFFN